MNHQETDGTSHDTEIVTLDTVRLQLRSLVATDLEDLMPILTNKTVMRWTLSGPLRSQAQCEKWLSTKTPGPKLLNFALRERQGNFVGNKIVGVLGSFGHPQLGYLLHPDYYGKGYATEALSAFVPAYFDCVPMASGGGHDILVANTDSDNLASQRVLEKCGFTRCELRQGLTEESTGLREIVVFRLARFGKTLEEMGLGARSDRPVRKP